MDPGLIRELLEDPGQHADLRLVKSRVHRGKLRSVYIYQERLVIKHYGARRARFWRQPHWRNEHDALERLHGLPVPRSCTYFRTRIGRWRSVVYLRECVACEPLTDIADPVAPEFLPEIARLMAQVHRRGVIASDYSLFNIRRAPDGRILFIDFDRARVFTRQTAEFWFYVGSDLAQFFRTPCRRDAKLFNTFLACYFDAMGPITVGQLRLIRTGCRVRCWQKIERAPRFPESRQPV